MISKVFASARRLDVTAFEANNENVLQLQVLDIETAFRIALIFPKQAQLFLKKAAELLCPQLTKTKYMAKIQQLKEDLPSEKDKLDELDFGLRYGLNTEHYALSKAVIDLTIPEKPVNVQLSELVDFFNELDFADPSKPNYLRLSALASADHASTSEKADLKDVLEKFIDRIKNNTPHLGAPRSEQERKKFYETIENALLHIVVRIREIEKTDKEGAAKCKAKFMQELLGAAPHCAPREYTMAVQQFRAIAKGVQLTLDTDIYELLAEMRGLIFESLATIDDSENILYYNRMMKAFGDEFALPGANIIGSQEDFFRRTGKQLNEQDKPQIRSAFYSQYTPANILGNVITELRMKSDLKNKAIELLKKYERSNWGGAKPFDDLKKRIEDMRKNNKSTDEIVAELGEISNYYFKIPEISSSLQESVSAHYKDRIKDLKASMNQKIVSMQEEGKSTKEIADYITGETKRIIHDEGITIVKSGRPPKEGVKVASGGVELLAIKMENEELQTTGRFDEKNLISETHGFF